MKPARKERCGSRGVDLEHAARHMAAGRRRQDGPAAINDGSVRPIADDQIPWWLWPTILSIDAPMVTGLWQRLLSRVADIRLDWEHGVVLAVSVWLAYAADRWIEGWRLRPAQIRTKRHRFYQRHRWPIAAAWLVAFAVDVAIAWVRLDRREFLAGLLLLGPVAAYLLSHQLVHRDHPWRAPKELIIAGLLAAGTALFVVLPPHDAVVWWAIALFTLLCFANCALISAWEREVDVSHGQTSLAMQFGAGARIARGLTLAIAVAAAALGWVGPPALSMAAACAGASALLLLWINHAETALGRHRARVLADVALMTPAIALLL